MSRSMWSAWYADAGMVAVVGVLFWASGVFSSGPDLVLAAVQILPLAVRRRAPGTVLAVVTVATVAHILLGFGMNIGYVPVLLGIYAAQSAPNAYVRSWLCAGAGLTISLAMTTIKGPINGGLLVLAISVVAWILGVERQRHLADRARVAELEATLKRERTAMRLHDALGQSTTVMLVQAEALRTAGSLQADDRRRVDAILAAGREAMTQVRRTLQELRSDESDDHEGDFPALVTRLTDAGLVVDGSIELGHLPRPARVMAERVLGEALTNVLRHAGPGVAATVNVRISRSVVDIRVRNRFVASERPGTGFGLSSLDSQLPGRVRYGRKGRYWVVYATVPLTFPDMSAVRTP
ncbi:signal transduction histidine kinase [Kibdelosporangium banguiense]|uniref:histidine kinase n=1 Tax=Kibdelosporangium banguiense TaxID=1365924 RepID=A0ABS4TR51_9PSEU|nr:histidine kinase [Kibdelosporangium banguiense]MBP2326351.1 signal transduction histidine kinase [Kibdelosporangium banguiense]